MADEQGLVTVQSGRGAAKVKRCDEPDGGFRYEVVEVTPASGGPQSGTPVPVTATDGPGMEKEVRSIIEKVASVGWPEE